MQLPKVFVGGSAESLGVAEALQAILDPHCDVTLWNQSVFMPGPVTVETLMEEADRFDFAVFVFSPDDRVEHRGGSYEAPRDNTVFEMGLFLAKLGLTRTYVLASTEPKVKLPSDLNGITYLTYRRRSDANLKAALGPCALDLKQRFTALGPRLDERPLLNEAALPDFSIRAWRYIADCVASAPVAAADSGNSASIDAWVQNVVGMLADLYATKSGDAYATWLRPAIVEGELRLTPAFQAGLPDAYRHFNFKRGEGLAGKVWAQNTTAATSSLRQHPWWVFRAGCENISYICAPVRAGDSDHGVLSVGSDSGFDISASDEFVVAAFAAVLAFVAESPASGPCTD